MGGVFRQAGVPFFAGIPLISKDYAILGSTNLWSLPCGAFFWRDTRSKDFNA